METKKCPICGGEINAEATRCKHCKEWINVEPNNPNSETHKPVAQELNENVVAMEIESIEPKEQPIVTVEQKKGGMFAVWLSIGLLMLTGITFYYSCIKLSENTTEVAGAMPEWLSLTLQLVLLFGILLKMHSHFTEARGKLAQYIFAILLTPFIIAIIGISGEAITEGNMARLLALPSVFGIIAGFAVANCKTEKAPVLGYSLIFFAAAECITAIFVVDPEIYWWSEILTFLSILVFSLVACNYFLDAKKYDVDDSVAKKQSPWFITIAVILMAILSLLMSFSSLEEEDFARVDDEYTEVSNNDESHYTVYDAMFFYRYKSVKFFFGIGLDEYDNSYIVESDYNDGRNAKRILSAEDLECDQVFELFQSNEYPYVVYYNGVNAFREFVYGIVDLRFHDHTLYESAEGAEILGLISQGEYAGCYVCLYDTTEVRIIRQDPPGLNPDIVATGHISDCMTSKQYDDYCNGLLDGLGGYDGIVIHFLESI